MMNMQFNGLPGLLILAGDIWAIINIFRVNGTAHDPGYWIVIPVDSTTGRHFSISARMDAPAAARLDSAVGRQWENDVCASGRFYSYAGARLELLTTYNGHRHNHS